MPLVRVSLLTLALVGCSGGGGGSGSAPAGPPPPPPPLGGDEICDNGIDDDLDGLVDCDDPDCYADVDCALSSVHVATTGTDSIACGSPGNPCRTIDYGIDQSSAGQTVYVHAGTYNEVLCVLGDGHCVTSHGYMMRFSPNYILT